MSDSEATARVSRNASGWALHFDCPTCGRNRRISGGEGAIPNMVSLVGQCIDATCRPFTVSPQPPRFSGRWGTEKDLLARCERALGYVEQLAVTDGGLRVAVDLMVGFELPPEVAAEVLSHFYDHHHQTYDQTTIAMWLSEAMYYKGSTQSGYLLCRSDWADSQAGPWEQQIQRGLSLGQASVLIKRAAEMVGGVDNLLNVIATEFDLTERQ